MATCSCPTASPVPPEGAGPEPPAGGARSHGLRCHGLRRHGLLYPAVALGVTALSLLPITYGVAYASTLGNLSPATMAKELSAEHKRWNLPLLSWEEGKVVATKP